MTHLSYKTIGGSRCGRKHVENQDRIILRTFPQADDGAAIHLIGVVDGISGSPFGASVARWLVEKHLSIDDAFHGMDGDFGGQLEAYLQDLYVTFQQEFEDLTPMLRSGASVSIAVICRDRADCLWVGDSPIYFSEMSHGTMATRLVSVADKMPNRNVLLDCFGACLPFHLKRQTLCMTEEAIVTITSDGATYDESLLTEVYKRLGFQEAVIEEIITVALSDPYSDDTSIVACRAEP